MKIKISMASKMDLIKKWGPEVILRCKCGDVPSHTMWGQYGNGVCPKCRQKCEMIPYEWGVVDNGS